MSRAARIKLADQSAVYHCINRTAGGDFLLDARGKEVLRKQLWQVAQFSGVEVFTYCLMSNHFHILVRVPQPEAVSNKVLLNRMRILYHSQSRIIQYHESVFRSGGDRAQLARQRLLSRMYDVSEFMKTLKQRFSLWYNKSHGRTGTLWCERFKSVVLEDNSAALRAVAAYIDLNPVRAGLCQDPKDYRWCGYGEAMGGGVLARKGLNRIFGNQCFSVTQST